MSGSICGLTGYPAEATSSTKLLVKLFYKQVEKNHFNNFIFLFVQIEVSSVPITVRTLYVLIRDGPCLL